MNGSTRQATTSKRDNRFMGFPPGMAVDVDAAVAAAYGWSDDTPQLQPRPH